MALKDGDTYYCKLTHYENGQVMHRRLYTVQVQGPDGTLRTLSGPGLPDAIVTSVGQQGKQTGAAQVLLGHPEPDDGKKDEAKKMPLPGSGEAAFWPKGRDVTHVALGMFLLSFFLWLSNLAEAAQAELYGLR